MIQRIAHARDRKSASAYFIAAAICLAATQQAHGQAASPTPAQNETDKKVPVENQTPAAQAAEEDMIVLSPFTVDASEDSGYAAKNTLAGTRVRTELKDVGSAISVVTSKFLTDTNSKNSESLLTYTTGTEVAGQGGNFVGGGDGNIIDSTAYTRPVANTRVRGLAEADNVRDFFLTDIPWDSYNVGRVDLQRGPNSILFGIGSPAGIINTSVNTANFKNANKVEVQVSNMGSYRGTFDFNKVLIKHELAIDIAGLYDNTKYKQKPAYRDDHRLFAAIKWEPNLFKMDGAHTSFRVNYEKGDVNGNNPRLLPPMDNISPWFVATSAGGLGKQTFTYQDSNNLTTLGNASYNPWIGAAGNRIYDGNITAFNSQDATTQGVSFVASVRDYPTAASTQNNTVNGSYKGITTYDSWAFNTGKPGSIIRAYKAKSLTDSSVFDFYNNLIEGPNKKNWTKFKAYNFNASQTFFNNKLGFELAYDSQDSRWGYKNFVAYDASSIAVDVMSTFADGSANPNVGKAMLVGGGGSAGSGKAHNIRDSIRGTVFGELNASDLFGRSSVVSDIIGKHNFTYSKARQAVKSDTQNWNNWYVGDGYGPTSTVAVGQAGRDDTTITYLSGNLSGVSSMSGLNLGRLTAIQEPTSTTVKQWDTTTKSFISYNLPIVNANSAAYDDNTRPYTQARKYKDVVESDVMVWQGYLFNGNIVPMAGWRRDVDQFYDAGAPNKVLGIITNFTDPNWRLPTGASEIKTGTNHERDYNRVAGVTKTWSVVGKLPKSWIKSVPGGLGASIFYNRSENFKPDASRVDILGNHIPSPQGKTKDYGITLSALDEKIVLKINKYETSVSNSTLSGELGNSYLIGAGEAWGQAAAYHLGQDDNQWPGDGNYGTTTGGKILHWQPADGVNNSNHVGGVGSAPYTQAAIDAQWAIQDASTRDWLSKPIPESMQRAWGMTGYATGSGSWSMNSVAVTGDTLSKGTEFELIANPISGLEVSINASKTDAQRLNIGKAYSDWLEKRIADYAGPMGDMRLWGNGNWALTPGSGGTVRDKFNNEVLPNYKLALALNNSSVPELRPWRFNTIANYSFKEGVAKGFNVGFAYRWEDKSVTGFKLNAANDGYDVTQKYYGTKNDAFDFWVGYQRKISAKMTWRIQLNIRDMFAKRDLIPITVQPDGSPAAYRIPEPRTINLTNTLEF